MSRKISINNITYITLFSAFSLLGCFAGIKPAQAVPLDPDYEGKSYDLDIVRYCREEHGSDAWAEVEGDDHKWYNWKCAVPSGDGAGVGTGGVESNSATTVLKSPVHLNDVCENQYGGLFKPEFEAFRIGENSGDIRCREKQ